MPTPLSSVGPVATSSWPLHNVERIVAKCWEIVGKPAFSFGTAHDWDPADPFATASNPDNLTAYLNTAAPVRDEECRECVWLPHCVGGCPHRRLLGQRQCVAFKDDPEGYALALHARIGADKKGPQE